MGGRHLGAVVDGERGLRPDGVELQIHDRIDEQRMHRVPGRAAHETVEGDVVQARVDTAADDVGALLEGAAERLHVLLARAPGGQPCDLRLDEQPRLDELGDPDPAEPEQRGEVAAEEADVDRAHEVAATRAVAHVDQATMLQGAERLADGHAAGPELTHQLALGRQAIAAPQTSFEDRRLDLLDDVLVNAWRTDGAEHGAATVRRRTSEVKRKPDGTSDPPRAYNRGLMTKRERIVATLERRPVDRPAVAFWRHVPEHDHDPTRLARAMLEFHRRFDLDLIKVMSSGVYCVEDWGCRVAYAGAPSGAKQCTEHAVKDAADWARIRPLDPGAGALGRELEAVRLIAAGRPAAALVLHTLFSPLTIARKLAGDRVAEDLRARPEAVSAALDAITETVLRYAEATLDAGADGVFLATQAAAPEGAARADFERFDVPPLRRIVERLAARSRLTMLHVHGRDVYWDAAAALGAHALNWHDRLTAPSLREAAGRFGGAVV